MFVFALFGAGGRKAGISKKAGEAPPFLFWVFCYKYMGIIRVVFRVVFWDKNKLF